MKELYRFINYKSNRRDQRSLDVDKYVDKCFYTPVLKSWKELFIISSDETLELFKNYINIYIDNNKTKFVNINKSDTIIKAVSEILYKDNKVIRIWKKHKGSIYKCSYMIEEDNNKKDIVYVNLVKDESYYVYIDDKTIGYENNLDKENNSSVDSKLISWICGYVKEHKIGSKVIKNPYYGKDFCLNELLMSNFIRKI